MKISRETNQIFKWALLLHLLFILSCKNKSSSIDWDELIQKYSAHSEDSLRLKACLFLKKEVEENCSFSQKSSFVTNKGDAPLDIRIDTISSQASIERICKENGLFLDCRIVEDRSILSEEFIEKQIEQALSTWKKWPWSRDIEWELFLEYVLPFKILHDYPEDWREYFHARYSKTISEYLADSISLGLSKIKSSNQLFYKLIVEDANVWYRYSDSALRFGCGPSLSELLAISEGDCYNTAFLGVYIMRTFGVPSSIDIVPLWGSKNGSHATEVFVDSNHHFQTPSGRELYRAAKVFRFCFSRQGLWSDSLKSLIGKNKNMLKYLEDDYLKDVTQEHTPVCNISVTLADSVINSNIAYICVFNYGKWQPVYFGTIDESNTVVFKNMSKSILYRVAIPDQDRLKFIGDVFLADSIGLQYSLYPSYDKRISMKLGKINSGTKSWVKKSSSYNLYSLEKGGVWKLLGKNICKKDSVVEFINVPSSGVYRLLESGGDNKLERMFTYSKSKGQYWY